MPPAILSQLDNEDASIFLSVNNVAVGSTVNATLSYHEPIVQTEGIFVATFDKNGVLVSSDAAFHGTVGEDIFQFDEFAGGANLIDGFVQGDDRIDLSGIDANGGTPGDAAFLFIGAAAFNGTAGQLRAEVVAGYTLVSGDVDGDGTADFHIDLVGSHILQDQDFML